jgi:hypothetical protein
MESVVIIVRTIILPILVGIIIGDLLSYYIWGLDTGFGSSKKS